MPRILPLSIALSIAVCLGTSTFAQDQQVAKKEASRQKAAVAAALKKADLGKTAVVETEHFFVATTSAEDRARALGAALEKVVPVARKALQFEAKDEPWKGKLAVYFLPDGRDFKSFMRNAVVAQPDGVHSDIRSDDPFVVDPAEVPGKATEVDQFAGTAAVVARAFLKAKGSTANVPEWLSDGFGRITALRAEGVSSRRYAAYKSAAKGLAAKGGKVTDLWAETKPASAELLSTSFADYLAYGPGAANFLKLVNGFRPDESGNTPGIPQAFEAAGWKDLATLETAWRKWTATGK